jgi:AcrR family transcriptional regulator
MNDSNSNLQTMNETTVNKVSSNKPSLVEIRRKRNRQDILVKAAEIAIKKGVEGLSMEEIAEHVNLTRATLYTFFDNKYEIINAIIHPILDNLVERISTVSISDPKKALEDVFQLYLDTWNENAIAMKVLNRMQTTVFKDGPDEKLRKEFIHRMELIFEAAKNAGILRTNDAALSAKMLMTVSVPTLEILEYKEDRDTLFKNTMKAYLLLS